MAAALIWGVRVPEAFPLPGYCRRGVLVQDKVSVLPVVLSRTTAWVPPEPLASGMLRVPQIKPVVELRLIPGGRTEWLQVSVRSFGVGLGPGCGKATWGLAAWAFPAAKRPQRPPSKVPSRVRREG